MKTCGKYIKFLEEQDSARNVVFSSYILASSELFPNDIYASINIREHMGV